MEQSGKGERRLLKKYMAMGLRQTPRRWGTRENKWRGQPKLDD